MALEPPHFQEADRCDVCKCSFSTFRRRHHCRRCGRTLCHEHSSNQMALPQFGIHSSVRVCADCFNDSTLSGNVNQQASSDGVNSVADKVSRLDIGSETDSNTETATQHNSATGVIECKCGMPLCICETPAPTIDAPPLQMKTPSSASQSNPKPKKTDAIPKNRGSTSNNKPRTHDPPPQMGLWRCDWHSQMLEVCRGRAPRGFVAATAKGLRICVVYD